MMERGMQGKWAMEKEGVRDALGSQGQARIHFHILV